eukprot:g11733.t1
MNDYLAMAVGLVLTLIVQSSSVVTSALTPLCGVGVLPAPQPRENSFALHLGDVLSGARPLPGRFSALWCLPGCGNRMHPARAAPWGSKGGEEKDRESNDGYPLN